MVTKYKNFNILAFGVVILLSLASTIIFLGDAHGIEKNTNIKTVKGDLNETLSYAIELLEKNKIKIFLNELIYPKELNTMLKVQTFNDFKKKFIKKNNDDLSKAERLLMELKYIKMRHPTIDTKNLHGTARFSYDQPSGTVKIITFSKIDGEWWIVN